MTQPQLSGIQAISMSNTKISALTSATTPLAGTEILPIVQSGATTKVTVANLTAGRAVTLGSNSSNETPFSFGGANYGFALTSSGNPTGYLNNLLGAPQFAFGGYYYGSGSYYPTSTGYSAVDLGAGTVDIYGNTGLTIGTTFTRTKFGTFSAGNYTPATASKGINFTANTPASGMTSQLLNWYEEGTWTAALTASVTGPTTPVTVTGNYIRIGSQVTIWCSFNSVNTTGASGDLQITGLPFVVGTQEGYGTAGVYNLAVGPCFARALPSTSTVGIAALATTIYSPVVITAAGYLLVQVSYKV